MKEEENVYVVIAAPSDYSDLSLPSLPEAVSDGKKVKSAFRDVLHIPEDNIRLLGSLGFVTRQNFAHALAEYRGMADRKDTLILYFSGHGLPDSLVLSDGAISLTSILQFIGKLQVGRAVLIQDSCYAGQLRPNYHAEQYLLQEGFDEAVRQGVAILSSSAAEVYHSKMSERHHSGEQAAAIWFYFACDDDDISMDRYYAVATWAATPELKKRYYRMNSTAKIIDDICISENASYKLLREMQKVILSEQKMNALILL